MKVNCWWCDAKLETGKNETIQIRPPGKADFYLCRKCASNMRNQLNEEISKMPIKIELEPDKYSVRNPFRDK